MTNQKGTIVEDYDIKMAIVEFDMGGIYKLRKLNLIKINESEDNDMAKLEGYKAVAVIEGGLDIIEEIITMQFLTMDLSMINMTTF